MIEFVPQWRTHHEQATAFNSIAARMRLMEFDQMCLANFTAYHGQQVHEAANMPRIRDMYCKPWRKSPIPHVARPAK